MCNKKKKKKAVQKIFPKEIYYCGLDTLFFIYFSRDVSFLYRIDNDPLNLLTVVHIVFALDDVQQ